MAKAKLLVFLLMSLFFLALGLVADFYFHGSSSERELAARVSKSLQRELAKVEQEALLLLKQPKASDVWQSRSGSFFLIDSLTVLQWTQNDFLPNLQSMQEPFTLKLLQVTQGDFLVRKWPVRDRVFLLCVVPLQKDYHIVNNYLSPEWNTSIFATPLGIVDPAGSGQDVLLLDGRCIFKIRDPDSGSGNRRVHLFGLVSLTLSILIFLVFVYGVTKRWHQQKRYAITFFGLAISLITLRILMVKSNFPNVFSDFALFDPHRFASSSFNASMGDLLLNSLVILALCLYLFLNYPKLSIIKMLLTARPLYQLLAGITCLVTCFLSLLYPYLFIEIIYHNSSISLEITDSVMMDDIRWVAFLSTLIGCVSGFLFIHIFFRITLLLTHRNRRDFWIALFAAALIFLAYFSLTQKNYWIPLAVGLVYFALLFIGNGLEQFTRFTFKTFLYFLVVIMVLAFQGALSLRKFNEERRVRDQFRFGNKFLVDQDVLGEFLLNESVKKISRDPFIQVRFLSPFLSKNSIRQKVREFYLNTYFDRYDIQVYLYDAGGEPYAPQSSGNFASLIENYEGETYKTAYPGIYFINTPTSEATKQYLVIIPVQRHQLAAGFVVLNLKLKRVIPRNVYPELLVDNRFSHYFMSKDFSYAFYSRGKLTNSFGEFNYDKDFNRQLLGDMALYRQGIAENDFYHIGIEDRDGQSVVVTAKTYPLFFLVTNFSFLFVIGLIPVLLLLLIMGATTWLTGSRLDYAARIQLYVYLAFFLPLLTVSITTLSLTKHSAEDQLRLEYEERSQTLGEKISGPLQKFVNEPVNNRSENQITELAKLAGLDASVYGTDGVLLVSSQPLIFENQLTSTLVNHKAWNAIVHDKEASFVANEKIGKLQYNCSYVAIKSAETGKALGILSIPFFGSAQSLEKIQINVLANILTVFVLVFILFSILSFIIANGLTFPLRFIAKSIKKTKLTEKNQLILWNSNDEIGLLANEYNRMIKNLEQSRIELERIQKETAWREIAKQVAHEIKNPLTPMKLTLQQMEQSLNGAGLSPEKSRKAVEMMLTQLEILNEIATSFSTFARMPAPVLEQIDLNTLLTNLVGLHQNYPEGAVTLQLAATPVFALGNEQLLSRVFGNIILNALQSGEGGKKVTVSISLKLYESKCLISFEDNGKGIDADIRDKVFLPHFSTKRTGSGLGLAIALQGIEQSGGRIWFETSPGKGTTFYIELLLA